MKNSIYQELHAHVMDLIEDGVLTADNFDEWHFHAFNEDYYIIGYYNANEWLKKHDLDTFEAIAICQDYERDNFGDDAIQDYDNPQKVVNMLAYIYGEEVIADVQDEARAA